MNCVMSIFGKFKRIVVRKTFRTAHYLESNIDAIILEVETTIYTEFAGITVKYEPLLTMHNSMPGASVQFNEKYDKMTTPVVEGR